MNKEENKKGIIYVRVSTDKQVEGTSLESQEKACVDYCQNNDIDISRIFRDKGESAKSSNRPEFLKAIDYCRDKKNGIKTFVVWKVDRFARNTSDHAVVKIKLREVGVRLDSVTEPIGSDSPTDNLMETMLSGFAQFDNDVRSQRSIEGMSSKIRQGIVPYNAPLGYVSPQCGRKGKKKDTPDTPHPEVFPILQKGLKEFAKGDLTKPELGIRFKELGLSEFNKYYSTKQGIHKLFKEDRISFYAGLIWNPFESKYYQGLHEPMITLEERDAILEIASGSKRAQVCKRKNPAFPLRGFIKCEECNSPLTGSSSTGRKGKKYSSYHCFNSECSQRGKTACLSSEAVSEVFSKELKDIVVSPEKIELLKEAIVKEWNNRSKLKVSRSQALKRKLSILETKRENIFEMREDGSYSKDDFMERKNLVDKDISLIQNELAQINEGNLKLDEYLGNLSTAMKDLGKVWKIMDLKNKYRFQKLVFPNGVVYKKKGSLGTADMGYLVSLFSSFGTNKSPLVGNNPIDWNRLGEELGVWFDIFKTFDQS